jgi:hypothetical protein
MCVGFGYIHLFYFVCDEKAKARLWIEGGAGGDRDTGVHSDRSVAAE